MINQSEVTTTEFPYGALALQSPLYIERPPIESLCYQNLQVSGSLTRIKGPRHMGKSSLLIRILDRARQLDYKTAAVNFQSAEAAVYSDLSRFLKWFCIAVTRELQLPLLLEDYWDDDTGAKLSATIYFEDYLLEAIKQPVVLALNEVNQVFEHPKIARDFLPMLRVWYEQAKQEEGNGDLDNNFQKLRTIVVHSTDVYVPINIHQSPFNVGLPVRMRAFDTAQARQLAERYGLALNQLHGFRDVVTLVGGHPYLLSIAFYYLKQGQLPLNQLLSEAATPVGIYRHHLQACLETVQRQPTVASALQQVVTSPVAVTIDAAIAYQLSSLGIVTLEGNLCRPTCELYRRFFAQAELPAKCHHTQPNSSDLLSTDSQTITVKTLRAENARLKTLANLDELTKVANRRRFEAQIKMEWQEALNRQSMLSLIMLDIDFFKRYNDTYGHLSGDFCLQQVAQVLSEHVRKASDTVARYGGEEFAIILPRTEPKAAAKVAGQLCKGVRSLDIMHDTSELAQKTVTVSVGVASVIPSPQQPFTELIAAADAALYVSKQQGRDRVTMSSALMDDLVLRSV